MAKVRIAIHHEDAAGQSGLGLQWGAGWLSSASGSIVFHGPISIRRTLVRATTGLTVGHFPDAPFRFLPATKTVGSRET